MIAISTKELRQNFPFFVEQLKKGERFLLIHKSTPIAEIHKPNQIQTLSEATEKDIENASLSDVSEDFLEEAELDYYLSLK